MALCQWFDRIASSATRNRRHGAQHDEHSNPVDSVLKHGRFWVVLLFATSVPAISCGGNSTGMTSPTGGSGSRSCRPYATSYAFQPPSRGTSEIATARFNTSTFELATTIVRDGSPCTTTVQHYRSTADFVDEVRTNPPLRRDVASNTSFVGSVQGCNASATVSTYAYDEQGRQTQEFANSLLTLVYDQWDSSGRPTRGSYQAGTLTREYDDVGHTRIDRSVYPSLTETSVRVFDANGQLISFTQDLNSSTIATHVVQTIQIMGTDVICK